MRDHPAAKGLDALRRGAFDEALAFFDSLIQLEPNGVPGHFLRAEALDRMGRSVDAAAALTALIARFPFAEGACQERLALIALRNRDGETALAALTRARAAGWANPAVVRAEPAFAFVSADPRFTELLRSADAAAE